MSDFRIRNLGLALRDARIIQGLSLQQAANRVGVTKPNVHRRENGSENMRIGTLFRYAAGLGARVNLSIEVPGGCERGLGWPK